MNYKTLFSIIYAFCVLTNFAQNRSMKFEHLTVEDGLSNNFVYCTMEDNDGYIWFGTENGLNRWDGYNFKVFKNDPDDSTTLSHDQVFSIFKDSDGSLWVSTGFGLNKYNKLTENFERYNLLSASFNYPYANSIGLVLEESKNKYWIGTKLGLVFFDYVKKSYQRFIPDSSNMDFSIVGINNIIWIYLLVDKKILVGSSNGVLEFDSRTKSFRKIIPQTEFIKDKRLRPVADAIVPYVDENNNLWIQTIEGGLHLFNLKTKKFIKNQMIHKITGITDLDQTWSIVGNKDNIVWIAHIGIGLFQVNLRKSSYENYLPLKNQTNSLSSRWLTNVYLGKDNIIWASTFDKGINKISVIDNRISLYQYNEDRSKSPPAGEIMDFCEDNDGWMWIVSVPGGAAKYNVKKKNFVHIPYLKNDRYSTVDRRIVSLLKDAGGNLWLGSAGFEKYNPSTQQFYRFIHNSKDSSTVPNNWIISLFEDKKKFIWCGTRGSGVSRLNPTTENFLHFKHSPTNPNSLCNDIVRTIEQDYKGEIWFGTENGISKTNRKNIGKNTFTNYKHKKDSYKSIASNFIYSIFEDSKKQLWIGTTRGLNLYNRNNDSFLNFKNIDALYGNIIYSILEDKKNNLWLRSNIGLIRFNPTQNKIRIFTEKDGLENSRSIVYGYNGMEMDSKGYLYYSSPQNMLVFHPDSLEVKKTPPSVNLTDLYVNYKIIKSGKNSIIKNALNFSHQINLEYFQNNIEIKYCVLDFKKIENIKYSYKLEGFNDNWINSKNRRNALYTNIAPGNYKFIVKASYDGDKWSNPKKSLIVIIHLPWWATWWFRLFAFIMLLLIGYLIFRYRVNQLLQLERMRIQIASDLHDDVGSSLTKIAIHSEIIKNTEDKIKITSSSAKIGTMSREIITSLSDIIWSIDARNDKVGDLVDRMRDYLETVFPSGSITTSFQTHGLIFENNIAQELRQNIYLIFKEAVNNSAKHSDATEVKILLKNKDAIFRMEISDNGKGINVNKKNIGNHGLQNMKLRSEKIKSTLKIENNNGTKIILSMKEL